MNQQQFQGQQRGQENQQFQGNGTKERKPIYIEADPVDFPGLMKMEYTTSMDLAQIANSLFKPVFSDWEGSILTFDSFSGQFILSVFLKDKGNANEGQYSALDNVVKPSNGMNVQDRIRNFNARSANKTYELTQEAKDIFGEFMFTRPNQKPNWGQLMQEVSEPTQFGYQIYVKLTGLDITKILKKKYGKKVDGQFFDYQVEVIRPLLADPNIPINEYTNYLVRVNQLNTSEVEKLCTKMGMVPSQGTIAMVR